jgi:hypothetical protein
VTQAVSKLTVSKLAEKNNPNELPAGMFVADLARIPALLPHSVEGIPSPIAAIIWASNSAAPFITFVHSGALEAVSALHLWLFGSAQRRAPCAAKVGQPVAQPANLLLVSAPRPLRNLKWPRSSPNSRDSLRNDSHGTAACAGRRS